MRERGYYSSRSGKPGYGSRFDLSLLRELFVAAFDDFLARGYFQEMLGKECVDSYDRPIGTAGHDVEAFVFRHLRRKLWPIAAHATTLSEDDVFDLIEFLYDHVSEGVEGYLHEHGGCGVHFTKFDRKLGQSAFRKALNGILRDYSDGFELSAEGEIFTLAHPGFATLLNANLPAIDPQNVNARVEAAKRKFRNRSSDEHDRRDAVRDLVDVMEFLRQPLKGILNSKDDADLFNLANNFGIRHHRAGQQTNYDADIWLSWMFYFYLATIHASVRLLERKSQRKSNSGTKT